MTPNRPFADVGLDLFEFHTSHYLVLVDYYSKFIEVDQLPDTSSASVIHAIKTVLLVQHSREVKE